MSNWFEDLVESVAEGDVEGASEAATEGFNDTGEAASEATGGAVGWEADEDGMSGNVGGASADIDTDASDGEVGGGVDVEFGAGVGGSARGSADVDASDGTAGVEAEVSSRALGHEVGVGADVGNRDQPAGQTGIDIGGRLDSHEVGVTANLDVQEEQAGLDVGGYYEDDSGRMEGGLTANADQSFGQAGLDVGGFVEGYDSEGRQGAREEIGVTVNVDANEGGTMGERVNLDAGVYSELDTGRPEYDLRGETGVTAGLSTGDGRASYHAGVYGEATADEADQEVRGEAGLGVGVTDLSEDDTGGGVGFGVGTHLEVGTDDGESYDSAVTDFQVGASVDEDGVVIGASGGMDSTDEDGRNSAQLGLRLGADDGRAYGGVVLDAAGDSDYEAGVWVGNDGDGSVGAGTYGRDENAEELDFGTGDNDPIRLQGDGISMSNRIDSPDEDQDGEGIVARGELDPRFAESSEDEPVEASSEVDIPVIEVDPVPLADIGGGGREPSLPDRDGSIEAELTERPVELDQPDGFDDIDGS